jgi:hypothetical protein
MRRLASILLLLCFATLGTGLAQYWHEQQHEREDRIHLSLALLAGKHLPVHGADHDSDCPICMQLHVPHLPATWTPILLLLGLLLAFLQPLLSRPLAQPATIHIDCRGPPTR